MPWVSEVFTASDYGFLAGSNMSNRGWFAYSGYRNGYLRLYNETTGEYVDVPATSITPSGIYTDGSYRCRDWAMVFHVGSYIGWRVDYVHGCITFNAYYQRRLVWWESVGDRYVEEDELIVVVTFRVPFEDVPQGV